MSDRSLDSILDNLETVTEKKSPIKEGGPVTIWLPREYKARYDLIQRETGRKFGKTLREMIQVAIDRTEPRVSSEKMA